MLISPNQLHLNLSAVYEKASNIGPVFSEGVEHALPTHTTNGERRINPARRLWRQIERHTGL